jgi:hypothetical protein
MLTSFFIAADASFLSSPESLKRLSDHRCPLGVRLSSLDDSCHLFVKFRGADHDEIRTDTEPCRLQNREDRAFVASPALSKELLSHRPASECALFYFDGSPSVARCVYYPAGGRRLTELPEGDPSVRLAAYDLPPTLATVIDTPNLVRQLLALCADDDPELFAPQANRFLNGPHILDQLLTHLMELKLEEAPNFLTVTKGLADQLRGLLAHERSSVRVRRMPLSHQDAWAEVYGSTVSFVDGGAARLTALPGVEPAAMRVGAYSVIPGEKDPDARESFQPRSQLIADMISRPAVNDPPPDRRRLQEACRYILELLMCVEQAERSTLVGRPRIIYLHGPLVNQFVQYDDEEPNNLPPLDEGFLRRYGIDQAAVTDRVSGIPPQRGVSMWNHFMALYGYLLRRVEEVAIPIVGVVERSVGSPLIESVLGQLQHDRVVNEAAVNAFKTLQRRYRITDTLLFGCLLSEGEYITPLRIRKNNERRARDRWKPVVRGYLSPFASILKPADAMPPLRVELNEAASEQCDFVVCITYHSSRLLPRYVFPVGLDIVDKYVKVPDWISRGVSATMAANVLRRALLDGDARVFAQARHFLAGEPRDFFFRPRP